jgi:hypothetical protein
MKGNFEIPEEVSGRIEHEAREILKSRKRSAAGLNMKQWRRTG